VHLSEVGNSASDGSGVSLKSVEASSECFLEILQLRKSITLVPTTDVQFEIRAMEDERSQGIAFELKWPSRVEESMPEVQSQRTGSDLETYDATAKVWMNLEAEERKYAELEGRFERELFGACGCVAAPGKR
jgi:hypothetical protein